MSYLLEALGRGLLGRLYDAFRLHLPQLGEDDAATLRRRLAQSPTSSDLLLRLGVLQLQNLELDAARRALQQASEHSSNPRQAALGLACVHDELGDLDATLRYLAIAGAQDPADPAIAFAVGYCYERREDRTAAKAAYHHALSLHPYLRNAYERLAAIALAEGAPAEALAQYERLAEVEPEDHDVLLTIAALRMQDGDSQPAVELYQRALLVDPQYEDTLSEAEALTDEAALDEAIARVEALVAKYPGVADFHVHLGDLYAKAHHGGKALLEYQSALEYHPGFLEATIKLGTQQLRLGLYVDAAQSFMRAVELNDRLILTFVGLGVAQEADGRLEDAEATFGLAASLEPNSALLFSETTRLSLQPAAPAASGGDTATQVALDQALALHEQAVSRNPNHADLHYRHGLLLRQCGDLERAITSFEAAVKINPQYVKALIKLGVSLKETARDDEALTVFQRAIALDAGCVDVHYQLGLLFAQRNRFDLAAEQFEQAVAGNQRNVAFRANLALALQNIGMVDRAQATWQSICELSHTPSISSGARETLLRSLGDE